MNHWFTWENGQFLPIFFHRYVCWLASSSHPHWPALTRAHAPRAPAPRARAAWDCYAWGQPRSEKMKQAVYAGYIYILVDGFNHSEKIYSQLGLLSPRYGKIKKRIQTTNQYISLKWGFPNMGVPQNGWFMENPIKVGDLGVPLF